MPYCQSHCSRNNASVYFDDYGGVEIPGCSSLRQGKHADLLCLTSTHGTPVKKKESTMGAYSALLAIWELGEKHLKDGRLKQLACAT